ncbi:MAG TPA: peptidoglycan-binding domain-containing protein [Terriglobia bacterium]|nr:peptidoglycan-binding domain-containing protein [Terriglobia bacterium]
MIRISANSRIPIRWALSTLAALLLIPGLPLTAKQKHTAHVAHRRSRRPKVTRRYKQVRIQPERVREIQQALAKAGVYHNEPSGQWDTATRDAMREFQTRNGFTPTGLPEAKPLLLLGLGPHPLPPALGPLPASEPEAKAGTPPSPAETDEDAAPTSNQPAASSK